ncbi:nectin-3-like [Danio aesculapii]|uniref:nectin-3-like n=1 Tax=Danio aesculapii TaxID=1142201 RepID=UPI0024C02234|nr:nectin-3-like [Danio aesculapii]
MPSSSSSSPKTLVKGHTNKQIHRDTVASQQEGRWFELWLGPLTFLCGVHVGFLQVLRSPSPKTCATAYALKIVARGDTAVVFGRDASLSCTLPFVSGIKQVTWQRVRAQDVHTLATFSERFKDNVDEDFVGKIIFQASFNSTTIEIKNTTFEDEACYICSFKVYPTGPKRETLCITVKGISEITTAVNPADTSDPDVVVSCSATGKPAPTIQWKSTEQELKHFRLNNFTTHNNDSSTTVISNITLPLSQFHGKYVECLVQSDDRERSETIAVPQKEHKGNLI